MKIPTLVGSTNLSSNTALDLKLQEILNRQDAKIIICLCLARISHEFSKRGGEEAGRFKASEGSGPEPYLTVRRGPEPEATQKIRAYLSPPPKIHEKSGLENLGSLIVPVMALAAATAGEQRYTSP